MDIDLAAMKTDSIGIVGNMVFTITPELEWNVFRKRLRRLCDHFLLIASANLYADLEVDLFFLNLSRAAENWRRGLVIARDHYKQRVSFMYELPLHAAVVSQDITVLNGLKAAMPAEWVKGEEYPYRFYINWLLVNLATNGVKHDDEIAKLLESLEDCEKDPAESTMIKALLGLEDFEQDDFWQNFESLLYSQKEKIDGIVESESMSILEFAPIRYCWFEGMAWLKLAKQKGFRFPADAFIYCPEEALNLHTSQYNGDWTILHDQTIQPVNVIL